MFIIHISPFVLSLKPSLEGWKPRRSALPESDGPALKPSLEGWKHETDKHRPRRCRALETFLRGMETGDPKCWPIRAHRP